MKTPYLGTLGGVFFTVGTLLGICLSMIIALCDGASNLIDRHDAHTAWLAKLNLPPLKRKHWKMRSFYIPSAILCVMTIPLWALLSPPMNSALEAQNHARKVIGTIIGCTIILPAVITFILNRVFLLRRKGGTVRYFRARMDGSFVKDKSWWRWRPKDVVILRRSEQGHMIVFPILNYGRLDRSAIELNVRIHRQTPQVAEYLAHNYAIVLNTIRAERMTADEFAQRLKELSQKLRQPPAQPTLYRDGEGRDATFSVCSGVPAILFFPPQSDWTVCDPKEFDTLPTT